MSIRERIFTSEVWVQPEPVVNLFTNPNAKVDLTDATASGLSALLRDATASGFNPDYGTAFRLDASANIDSYMSMGGDTGAIRNGMQPGKTYTASATVFRTGALAATTQTRARRIVAFTRAPSGVFTEYASAQAPNTSGNTRLSVTFTIPADATEAFVRLYHGHPSNTLWWYQLRLSEGTETDFFDGASFSGTGFSTPEHGWDGNPHRSTSWRVKRASNVQIAEADMKLTYDVNRVPYINATITAPRPDAATLAMLDPRRGRDVCLTFHIDQLARASAGGPFTTREDGAPLGYSAAAAGKLWLRTLEVDELADTITLQASSGEIVADDKLRISTTAVDTGAATVEKLVEYALTTAGQYAAIQDITPAAATAVPAGDRRLWNQGEPASGLYESELAAVDLRLYCDDRGKYWVAAFDAPPTNTTPGSTVDLFDGDAGTLVNVTRTLERDGRGWADAVLVKADYTDAGGTRQTAYQRFPVGGADRKGLVHTITRAIPSASYAQSILARAATRGETLRITAHLDFAVRPARTVILHITGRPDVSVTPTRVTYDTTNGTVEVEGFAQ